MSEFLHVNVSDATRRHKSKQDGYEHYRRDLVPKGFARQCAISLYELPPGQSAYPYHYHVKNEEAFYILSGNGILRTPQGERPVSAGDFLFFPANEKGAHKLTNISETDLLVYLDFDTYNDIDIAFYPDSEKIGVWGKNINQLYKTKDQVEYYRDESSY
ncbi:putative cupin superfamily protein [Anaerotaenia torta]|uniref:cupin domain-containing protein n=1 Tax=Anaerotaenia torta TaxID=433293 RepID=UPI003D20DF3A